VAAEHLTNGEAVKALAGVDLPLLLVANG